MLLSPIPRAALIVQITCVRTIRPGSTHRTITTPITASRTGGMDSPFTSGGAGHGVISDSAPDLPSTVFTTADSTTTDSIATHSMIHSTMEDSGAAGTDTATTTARS